MRAAIVKTQEASVRIRIKNLCGHNLRLPNIQKTHTENSPVFCFYSAQLIVSLFNDRSNSLLETTISVINLRT
jgi:hypothetical protein